MLKNGSIIFCYFNENESIIVAPNLPIKEFLFTLILYF